MEKIESQNKPAVLYIAGTGRSGSTMLDLLLNEVLRQPAVGELFYFWHNPPSATKCGCGELIGQCPFWREVFAECGWELSDAWFEEMAALRVRVVRWRRLFALLFPAWAAPSFRADVKLYAQRCEAFYLAIAKTSGSNVVVDASKSVFFLLLMRHFQQVEFKILHLARDPRAVAFSWGYNQKQRPEVAAGDGYMNVISPPKVAFAWWLALIFPLFLRRQAGAYAFLGYEDLAADPKPQLQAVFERLRLSGDLSIFDRAQIPLRQNHTGAGNPIRFHSNLLEIRRDEKWRARMPFAARAVVSVMTLPWLVWKKINGGGNAR